VNGPSGTIATYKYDAAGRRIEKNVGGQITRYVYDGANILATLDGSNNLTALFTQGPGIDSPLIGRINGTDYFYHADALGSVVALTDTNGNTVETTEYTAFGQPIIKDAQGITHSQSTVGNAMLYTGTDFDAETGLNHMGFRYQDSSTGRFLQEDPIANINSYSYALNSPAAYRDPLGLYAIGVNIPDVTNTMPYHGGGFGYNLEFTSQAGWNWYSYSTPKTSWTQSASQGFLFGIGTSINFALGSGDWTGGFSNYNVSGELLGAGGFRSQTIGDLSDPGNWEGLSAGAFFGLPGIGINETEYTLIGNGKGWLPDLLDSLWGWKSNAGCSTQGH
jgi:RHS repeat-associated protein